MRKMVWMLFVATVLGLGFGQTALAQSCVPFGRGHLGLGTGSGWNDSFGVESVKGTIGGVQAGCTWQRGQVAFGFAGDLAISGIKGKETSSYSDSFGSSTVTRTAMLDRLSTVTGNIGYVTGPWTVYGEAGLALARVRSEVERHETSQYGTYQYGYKNANNATGWVSGLGVKYKWNNDWNADFRVRSVQIQTISDGSTVASSKLLEIGFQRSF